MRINGSIIFLIIFSEIPIVPPPPRFEELKRTSINKPDVVPKPPSYAPPARPPPPKQETKTDSRTSAEPFKLLPSQTVQEHPLSLGVKGPVVPEPTKEDKSTKEVKKEPPPRPEPPKFKDSKVEDKSQIVSEAKPTESAKVEPKTTAEKKPAPSPPKDIQKVELPTEQKPEKTVSTPISAPVIEKQEALITPATTSPVEEKQEEVTTPPVAPKPKPELRPDAPEFVPSFLCEAQIILKPQELQLEIEPELSQETRPTLLLGENREHSPSQPSPEIMLDGNKLSSAEAATKIQAAFRGYHTRKSLSRETSPGPNARSQPAEPQPDLLEFIQAAQDVAETEATPAVPPVAKPQEELNLNKLEEQLVQELIGEPELESTQIDNTAISNVSGITSTTEPDNLIITQNIENTPEDSTDLAPVPLPRKLPPTEANTLAIFEATVTVQEPKLTPLGRGEVPFEVQTEPIKEGELINLDVTNQNVAPETAELTAPTDTEPLKEETKSQLVSTASIEQDSSKLNYILFQPEASDIKIVPKEPTEKLRQLLEKEEKQEKISVKEASAPDVVPTRPIEVPHGEPSIPTPLPEPVREEASVVASESSEQVASVISTCEVTNQEVPSAPATVFDVAVPEIIKGEVSEPAKVTPVQEILQPKPTASLSSVEALQDVALTSPPSGYQVETQKIEETTNLASLLSQTQPTLESELGTEISRDIVAELEAIIEGNAITKESTETAKQKPVLKLEVDTKDISSATVGGDKPWTPSTQPKSILKTPSPITTPDLELMSSPDIADLEIEQVMSRSDPLALNVSLSPQQASLAATTPEGLGSSSGPDDEADVSGIPAPINPVRSTSPNPFGKKRRRGKKGGKKQ